MTQNNFRYLVLIFLFSILLVFIFIWISISRQQIRTVKPEPEVVKEQPVEANIIQWEQSSNHFPHIYYTVKNNTENTVMASVTIEVVCEDSIRFTTFSNELVNSGETIHDRTFLSTDEKVVSYIKVKKVSYMSGPKM